MKVDKELVVFFGGTRSGKSDIAQKWMERYGQRCTYVATLGQSNDINDRIARHQSRRAYWMSTIELESGDQLVDLIVNATKPLLIDSIGTWLVRYQDFCAPIERLCSALGNRHVPIVVVGEVVGAGVHPESTTTFDFVDKVGLLSGEISNIADQAFLVVANRLMSLELPWWS
ncbi:bifunctional adenosylcobinamide kinase/adenosylcobinamide-phosphate guanylyltransferase [Acidithrix sp. C25]|uniref:bifunctional adenosylcobinamide kinase/adenosylcobinamide-phosphate guanylyltransferase n=1 Tax=Acidithrix sp. C25 TaxID=1671482 RepID=UPI00191B9F67|nr:bifunctional adenosylcobinamide kinase/adenosylcobinamide-phosphate guanylyltransferase [Acidithrix sp. C25]